MLSKLWLTAFWKCSILRPHQVNSIAMYVSLQRISQIVDRLSTWVCGSGMQRMSLEQQTETSKTRLKHNLGQPSNMGAYKRPLDAFLTIIFLGYSVTVHFSIISAFIYSWEHVHINFISSKGDKEEPWMKWSSCALEPPKSRTNFPLLKKKKKKSLVISSGL